MQKVLVSDFESNGYKKEIEELKKRLEVKEAEYQASTSLS